MTNKKISKVQKIMQFYNMPCWLMYCDEKSDPYFLKIITSKTIVPAATIISTKECYIIVHKLDIENVERFDNTKILSYEKEDELWNEIEKVLKLIKFPDKICLTYSTFRDAQVDIIGFGLYTFLTKRLRKFYSFENLNIKFCSAEEFVYAFSDRKGDDEISKMRIAAQRALEILENAFEQIKPGMTELEIVELVHNITKHKPDYFDKERIISEEYAWDEDICPVVLAGPNLEKGGHAIASDLKIKRGYTIYFDFGVKLTFKDGSKWSSDIQRMGYVLKENETQAPQDVMRMFNSLVQAIQMGIDAIRPGMKGCEIDKIVRSHILKQGYPDYNHATGHSIGELSHNPGVLLGPKDRKLSHLSIQPNGVHTIEPRIAISNGGSVEEMVLVTSNGGIPLCSPQKTIYLIR